MQRIHILFIGFIFLNASPLSVFSCICKFSVADNYKPRTQRFFPSTALYSWRYLINTNMNGKHAGGKYKEYKGKH